MSSVLKLSRHNAARVIAAVLAVVTLAAPVSSFVHLVQVRHVACAEHGEMIDVGRVGSDVAPVDDTRSSSLRSSGAAREAHGHEHCALAPARRDRTSLTLATTPQPLAFHGFTVLSPAADDTVAPPIAVLVLAPKNSPPLA